MPYTASSMLIGELKVRAHVMSLGSGVYCLFLAKDQDFTFSKEFPAIKISLAPGQREQSGNVEISSFDNEGWLNEETSAVLIKVKKGPAQILVSFYDEVDSEAPLPRLQLLQVGGNEVALESSEKHFHREEDFKEGFLLAHVQEKGDVLNPLADWIGEVGSNLWIEGFKISVPPQIKAEDLEYQAVLGKGWLSPWVEGGEFCGSRGMSLPLLGLKVRLRGDAAEKWDVQVEAAFTDGFHIDNHSDVLLSRRLGMNNASEDNLALESPDHSPLEAFKVIFVEKNAKKGSKKSTVRRTKTEKKK